MAYGLLGVLLGADMNSTLDQQILLSPGSTPVDMRIKNTSQTLFNASGGKVFTNAGRTGIQIFDTSFPLGDGLQLLIYAFHCISCLNRTVSNSQEGGQMTSVIAACYFSLDAPEGLPVTADIEIYGYTA